MEEKIYERQVSKQSLALHAIDEKQLERHFNSNSTEKAKMYDLLNLNPTRKSLTFNPKEDQLLAEVIHDKQDHVFSIHEHESLLQNKLEEYLSEEERCQAWDTFRQIKDLQKMLPRKSQLKEFYSLFTNSSLDIFTDSVVTPQDEISLCDNISINKIHKPAKNKVKQKPNKNNENFLWQNEVNWKGILQWREGAIQHKLEGCQLSTGSLTNDQGTSGTEICPLPENLNIEFIKKGIMKRPKEIRRLKSYAIHLQEFEVFKNNMKNHYARSAFTDEKNVEHCLILKIFKGNNQQLLLGSIYNTILNKILHTGGGVLHGEGTTHNTQDKTYRRTWRLYK